MSQIIMALDQGTTSSRTILFDENGKIVAEANAPLACHYPQSGWVEQVPEEIWSSQRQTIEAALAQAKLSMKDISAVGITNQRESTIAWNRKTGDAIGPAINWQCRRTADFCEELKAEGFDRILKNRTGLVTDPYFSGTKMRWILENVPQARKLADQGNLCFGTVDSWLIWKLTGGRVHATEISNASRTLVFNIDACSWDDEILARFGIPRETLPEVKVSSGVIAQVDLKLFGGEAPIAGVAGDQQAALFGQACFEKGMAKNTYGTGCFLLMNTGDEIQKSAAGLLNTIAWGVNGKITYALEGSVFVAGAAIQWLRDGLQIIEDAKDTELIAANTKDKDVYVVPAFAGLGTPYWDMYSRGAIFGLTRDTGKNHIIKATLESLAYQSKDVLDAMQKDSGIQLKKLQVDGGACANDYLMQFQADILDVEIERPELIESTAIGAAYLAAYSIGLWSLDEIKEKRKIAKNFRSKQQDSWRKAKSTRWDEAVKRTMNWVGS